jgi:hypothetical protein
VRVNGEYGRRSVFPLYEPVERGAAAPGHMHKDYNWLCGRLIASRLWRLASVLLMEQKAMHSVFW